MVVAMATIHRAIYKTSAAKLILRATEGPLPTLNQEIDQINYSAGRTAKEQLLKKLERG
jgi:hypothetical protein